MVARFRLLNNWGLRQLLGLLPACIPSANWLLQQHVVDDDAFVERGTFRAALMAVDQFVMVQAG